MSKIVAENSFIGEQRPLDLNDFDKLVNDAFHTSGESANAGTVTESILENLTKASSAHKFVVSITSITQELLDKPASQPTIENFVGGSWDKAKDGLYSTRIEKDQATFLVTVIWLAK
ncbi:LAMI_0E10418g1_1 [Lachancea mirantina]|uniref:Topoisomerase I damage affected protein 2 n=1 Tax=Lachancea mirantina TaxID=1230905 RepID=A0A1G4JNY7_9SACH|nr:LAMI_0E10418g1_1 [Lachancea mirantina]